MCKERTKVFVYWNLHKNVWSIKALNGPDKGRVIGHADEVVIDDAEFRVQQAGRLRVLREKCKNVHAGIVGYEAPDMLNENLRQSCTNRVRYNPYKNVTFVDDNGSGIRRASVAHLTHDRVVKATDFTEYIQ